MPQYLLAIYRDGTPRTADDFQQVYDDVNALADELTAAGGLVFAGGLNRTLESTTIRLVDRKPVITDGPFVETKEQLGGFWVIKAGDISRAREWGARLASAVRRPIEVSTFEDDDTPVEELFEHLD